jgi:sterol desaturase/sphingolipid hydroxylase (fatty acid hydroxylase superfamily)
MFAMIGAVRGWNKEVIAMAGLILALFTINMFGFAMVNLLGGLFSDASLDAVSARMKTQFIVLGGIFIVIAFFSYQGAYLVRSRLSTRERVQDRLLGLIFGGLNGYLLIGTLWSLLEFQITADGWQQLPANVPYAFNPTIIRPESLSPSETFLITHLPIDFLVPLLPILLVAIFLFLIVVII